MVNRKSVTVARILSESYIGALSWISAASR